MSATATNDTDPSGPPPRLDVSGTRAVPFGRHVAVELRKTFDTRAGFWLLMTIGLIEVIALVITLLVGIFNDTLGLTANVIAQVLVIPMALLVPVFAIMVITGEWGQRTTLATFALEPHRVRVVLAKLVTVLIVAVGTIVLAVVVGAVGNVLYGALSGDQVVWNLDAVELGWVTLQQVLYFVMAFALALLLLNTPGTIVLYYAVALLAPFMIYPPLLAFFETARDILPWVDIGYAMAPLLPFGPPIPGMEASTGMAILHTVVACGIWIGIPMVLGGRRVLRAEFK